MLQDARVDQPQTLLTPPRIRPVRQEELLALREIESAAGLCFADVGMPEIAADAHLPVSVFDRCRRAGLPG